MSLSTDAIDGPEECRRRECIELKGNFLARTDQRQICFRHAHFGGHSFLVDDLSEGIACLDHHTRFFFNFRSHHDASDRSAKTCRSDALLFELHFGSVKIGAHFGLPRGRWIIPKFRFRNFTASLRESGFGLGKLDAILAIVKLCEQLARLNGFTFVNKNVPYDSALHRAHDAAFRRDDGSVGAHPHRPWNQDENGSNDGSAFSIQAPAFLRHRGGQALFLLGKWLKNIREGNLLVELRVADCNSGLVGKNRNSLFVGVGKEVCVAAEKYHRAKNALIVAQRQGIHAVELVGFEKRNELRASLFRIGVPAIVVFIDGNGTFLLGYPLQAVAQFAHLARFWNLRFARDGAQNEFSPIEKADD